MAISAVRASRALRLRCSCPGQSSVTSLVRTQQRSSSSSTFAVHIPAAPEARINPARAPKRSPRSPRWQQQQPFAKVRALEAGNGALLLDRVVPDALSSESAACYRDLQNAIERQQLESLWRTFDRLQQSDKLAPLHVTFKEQNEIFAICLANVSDVRNGTLPKSWSKRFASLAHLASQTGDVTLIFHWFWLLLSLKETDAVVGIWNQLAASTKAAQLKSEPKSIVKPGEESTKFDTFGIGTEGYQVDVHDLACLVVLACHTSGSTSTILNCFEHLELGTPFQTYFNRAKARRMSQELCKETGDASYLNWGSIEPLFWQTELARGLSSGSGGPRRLARYMGSLFQLRQVDAALRLFQTAMLASTGPDAWLPVENVPRTTAIPETRVEWTDSCWAICLSGFMGLGVTEEATKVWSHYHAMKLEPTPRMWNALLDGYARVKNYDGAVLTWKEIMKQKPKSQDATFPDAQMYTTMINVLFRTRKPQEAMNLFTDVSKQGNALGVGAETYNTVIHGLCFNGLLQDAETVLARMRASGPAPNISTINTFLRIHARNGDLASLAGMLRLLGELKLTPDVVTFTTILDAVLRKGGGSATDSVVKVLKIMDTFNVKPNVITYTSMIKACLVGAEAANIDLVTNTMFGRPESGRGRTTDSSVASDANMEAALVLLDRMLEAGVYPTEITFSALIGGCLQNAASVADAFQRDLIPRRYKALPRPVTRLGETHDTVYSWQRTLPHVSLALLLLEQMKARRLPMTSAASHYLIEGLCSPHTDRAAFLRSLDTMDEMLLRSSSTGDASRTTGPFLASVLTPSVALSTTGLNALGHTSWVVILTSLLNRLEKSNVGAADSIAALGVAVRLIKATDLLVGSEGGRTLPRLVERAAALSRQRI